MAGKVTHRNAGVADMERLAELERCKNSSWYLAKKMGYKWDPKAEKGLTPRMHFYLCKWWDGNARDAGYNDEVSRFFGLWMRRGGHKTTLVIVWIIQQILRDPCLTHRYWHATEGLAVKTLQNIVDQIRFNKFLRSLEPIGVDDDGGTYNVFPRGQQRWYKLGKGDASFRLNRHKKYGGYGGPTLYAQGAGSESTGDHINGIGFLDDIISRKTIINSEVTKVAEWVESTVMNVVDRKWLMNTGTPWAEQSIHQQWMDDPTWRTVIIPGAVVESDEEIRQRFADNAMKIHFTPCYRFSNPIVGPESYKPRARKILRVEQNQSKGNFPPQIMCDPEPESEKPWSAACENFTGLKKTDETPGVHGPGTVFVLSDPAPFLEGGYKNLGEKARGDGTKDYWSLAVVKLRVRGNQQDVILLDGSHSQEWDKAAGASEAARLMKKWNTNKFFSENPKEHHAFMRAACLEAGVGISRQKDGGPLRFVDYNKADGKNSRINSLASLALDQRFWICSETCSEEFLYGDGSHTGFLTQMRKYRKVGPNKTNLRFDDDADVVARSTDEALQNYSPRPETLVTPMSPWAQDDEPEFTWGTKHVRA